MHMRLIILMISLVLGLVGVPRVIAQDFLGGSANALPDLGDSSASVLSPLMERRIGEEAMRQIRARDPNYVDDPELSDYLNAIGRKLVGVSGGKSQEFEFFAIRDDTVNAFAMPGGFVGVHTGLLLAAQTESELASVLAHEVSHVTQNHIARLVGRQSQLSAISIAGVLVALLASRSGSRGDLGQAALIASQGGAIQAQLGYTREFEREADRNGFRILQSAGFDANGMVSFFDRLQKATRTYENNAPSYLRSHPLTVERIADIQDRAQGTSYRQYQDSLEFHFHKSRLRAQQGAARDAVTYFQSQLEAKRYSNEAGARFGLASALIRARNYKSAEVELTRLRNLIPLHAMLDLLAVRIRAESGDIKGAADLAKAMLTSDPQQRPLRHQYAQSLQRLGQHQDALGELTTLGRDYPKDSRVFQMQAQSYAATGQRLLQHRAQAEAYFLQGAVPSAIEQLQMAQRLGEGDFYLLSSIDARLRELRQMLANEDKRR